MTPASGDALSVSFDNATLQKILYAKVTVSFTTAAGAVEPVFAVPKRVTARTGTSTVRVHVDGCAVGCSVSQVTVESGRRRFGPSPFLIITAIDFGGQKLLHDTTWQVTGQWSKHNASGQQKGTLRVYGGPVSFKAAEATQQLASLTTPGLDVAGSARRPIAYAVDGSEHPVDVVGTVDAVPLLGRRGMLLDLPRALAGGSTTIPTARSMVVARADTPPSVLDDLDATGLVSDPRGFDAALATAKRRADAQGVRLYVLMSVFAGLIALIGMAAAVTGQRDERRREAASLRVTGVHAQHIGAAHRKEAGWLAACAFVVVAVTGWLAARITLEGLALVPQTAYAPGLQGEPRLTTVLAVAAGAGLMVGVVTYLVNRGVARRSPPSILRDEVR